VSDHVVSVPRFRDPGLVQYCERCCCKTDFVVDLETDSRLCIYHLSPGERQAVEQSRQQRGAPHSAGWGLQL
jgi:hypothetical protein